jgi:putative serine protease PepD
MTDARPEPDKTEADPASEARPEPVWARPESPDPWAQPGPPSAGSGSGEAPAGASTARSADETQDRQAPASASTDSSWAESASAESPSTEPTSSESPSADSASTEPTSAESASTESASTESASTESASQVTRPVNTPLTPQTPLAQYEPPQYTPPAGYAPPAGYGQPAGYAQQPSPDPAPVEGESADASPAPAAQYPQYVAPQGFGSPHGPGPVDQPDRAATGLVPGFPGGPANSGQSAQPGQSAYPGQSGYPAYPAQSAGPGQSGYPAYSGAPADPGQPAGANSPSAPWSVDASQPTQQFDSGGWAPQPYAATAAPAGRQKARGALTALLLGACLLVGALGGVAGSALRDDVTDASGRNPTISLPKPAPVDANQATSAVTAVAAAVLPSVVSINVQAGGEGGTGSGFVIDADKGYILTNNHVVTAGGTAAATSIEVVFPDGTQVPGKVVGLDASYDLAVVKVTAKGLRQLTLGDSDSVRVGDPVVAIGAPLGLQGTVTTGIVSALNRPVAAGEGNKPAFINAIQTDAAINPGNSGGPLVDASGNVIAVNSAIARSPGALGSSAGNIGLGFAIPSNQARRTAEQLIRTGKASHPIIGVSLDSRYTGRGVKVSEQDGDNGAKPVTENGPADKAGIKAGDVILKIDGRPVTEPDELIVAIRAQTPGETITLTVQRGKTENEVRVKLSEATD